MFTYRYWKKIKAYIIVRFINNLATDFHPLLQYLELKKIYKWLTNNIYKKNKKKLSNVLWVIAINH